MSSTCKSIVNSKFFQRFIITTILLAGIVVGVQTYKEFSAENAYILNTLDTIILGIFVIEAAIKILAEGKRPQNYFKNPWNIFDFAIVVACLLEPIIHVGADFLPVLRLARILRVLRTIIIVYSRRRLHQDIGSVWQVSGKSLCWQQSRIARWHLMAIL